MGASSLRVVGNEAVAPGRPNHLISRKTANSHNEGQTCCRTPLQWSLHGQQYNATRKPLFELKLIYVAQTKGYRWRICLTRHAAHRGAE